MPEEERKDFHLYCDEFQNFSSPSFIGILSEARKYRLDLTLAHQYIEQLAPPVKEAIFGNVGTLICFRVGARDAEELEKEFSREFDWQALIRLPPHSVYIRLCIDGATSRPFNAEGMPPRTAPSGSHREKTIRASRERYCSARAEVERKITRWFESIERNVVRRGR